MATFFDLGAFFDLGYFAWFPQLIDLRLDADFRYEITRSLSGAMGLTIEYRYFPRPMSDLATRVNLSLGVLLGGKGGRG